MVFSNRHYSIVTSKLHWSTTSLRNSSVIRENTISNKTTVWLCLQPCFEIITGQKEIVDILGKVSLCFISINNLFFYFSRISMTSTTQALILYRIMMSLFCPEHYIQIGSINCLFIYLCRILNDIYNTSINSL